MAAQITNTAQKRYAYVKKRNRILFFVFISFLVLLISFIVLYRIIQIDIDLLATIYLPLVVIDLFIVMYLKGKFNYYQMHVQYLTMLLEETGEQKIKGRIFTPSWIEKIKSEGYTLHVDTPDFMLFYAFKKKLDTIINSGDTLMMIVVSKREEVSFFSEQLDQEMERVYAYEPKGFRTKRQITLHFKRFEKLHESAKDDIRQVINFKNNQQYLIQLNIGYNLDQNVIYFLCPVHRFPNKFYYAACQSVLALCGLKEKVKDE